jgi:ABC-type branched-subunit amino acid transport system permease subunit
LRSNWIIPLLLLALWPISWVVEDSAKVDAYWARIVILIGINITLAVSLQLINGISGQFSLGHAGFMAVGAYLAGYATKTFGSITTPDEDVIEMANPLGVALYFASLIVVLLIAGLIIYLVFLLIRQSRRIHPSLPGILMVMLFAWLVADIAFGTRHPSPLAVWTHLVQALHQLFDFLNTRAAGAALSISTHLPVFSRKPLTLLIALIGGGCLAALAGLVVGLPTLRLRGDYLAIATLGFAEIIRVAIVNSRPLGGATGLTNIPFYANPADPDNGVAAHYILPWVYGVAIVTIVVIWRIKNSAKGRALEAVREDEIAAASIGINPTHHKVLSFMIGAFFAGVAGALYAHYDGYLHPTRFDIMRSIELVVMVTLGGLGSISGAVLAAVVLTILPEVLRPVAEWRMVIYSLLLIGMMLGRPQGLLGGRELWWTRKRQRPLRPVPSPGIPGEGLG